LKVAKILQSTNQLSKIYVFQEMSSLKMFKNPFWKAFQNQMIKKWTFENCKKFGNVDICFYVSETYDLG
jgi:hypothetical protein